VESYRESKHIQYYHSARPNANEASGDPAKADDELWRTRSSIMAHQVMVDWSIALLRAPQLAGRARHALF
jgi:hypothetical protein